MDQFLQRFPRVSEHASGEGFWKGLLTGMSELGAFIGSLNQGWIADKISRKYSTIVAVVIFICGSVLQTAAVDYAMLITTRFIGGIGIGMLSMVGPLYISEIGPPELRGTLSVLEGFSIVSATAIAFWITYLTRFVQSGWVWRLPFLLQTVLAFVLGAGIYFLPFSPHWLMSKCRSEEALQSLAELRRVPASDSRVELEHLDIEAEVLFHREMSTERYSDLQDGSRASAIKLEIASWLDYIKRACWRRTHVGVFLMFFQQFVAINALIYYSPTLFKAMGLNYDVQLIMSGVLNITQLVRVATSVWTMDAFGRRPLLLIGSICMTLSHVIIAILVGKFNKDWPAHRAAGWTSAALLLCYMISFGASWG